MTAIITFLALIGSPEQTPEPPLAADLYPQFPSVEICRARRDLAYAEAGAIRDRREILGGYQAERLKPAEDYYWRVAEAWSDAAMIRRWQGDEFHDEDGCGPGYTRAFKDSVVAAYVDKLRDLIGDAAFEAGALPLPLP